MKKILAKIIHKINPTYFSDKSYHLLGVWGIEDVHEGKLIFE